MTQSEVAALQAIQFPIGTKERCALDEGQPMFDGSKAETTTPKVTTSSSDHHHLPVAILLLGVRYFFSAASLAFSSGNVRRSTIQFSEGTSWIMTHV
jgi:hypothetical protein